MNRFLCILLIICLSTSFGIVWADVKSGSRSRENVRIVLTIDKANEDPVSFSIVTAGDEAKLDNLAGTVEIDGNSVPVILRFKARLYPLGEDEYLVECTYGTSRPVVTAKSITRPSPRRSSTNRTASSARTVDREKAMQGVGRTTFQYRDIGAESTLRMKLGEEVTFTKDQEKEVILRLERVGDSRTP